MEWVELQESEESDEDCEREARAGAAEGGGREEGEEASAVSIPVELLNMHMFPDNPELWDMPHLEPIPGFQESITGGAAAAADATLEEPTANDHPEESA
eukprot:gnl/TRDRNA2_/TRDRNA2_177182_c1_seq10.p2 gnl/TRDRNA2_/TRDRNA2_177182_c1~~gnl/TRDRNA2_/TRDRNA2_177182_c1_seq10.p2  ORF type:complete len:106 (-),score=23.10 gnl/TRDRNA2_/TRDRNA2_177182_c1_seq10:455-751(-)